MGDRCYYRAEIRREDLCRFMDLLVGEKYETVEEFLKIYTDTDDGPLIEIEVEEINYGGHRATEKAAKEGLVFRGSHGAGGSYMAMSFIGIDGELHVVLDDDGILVTALYDVDDEGQASVRVNDEQLASVKAYAEAEWRFAKQFPVS